jgi:hypothetical protein
MATNANTRPHPDLRWRRPDEGRIEVRLACFDQPIARAERLHDGTWVAAVRPLRNGPEKAVIVDDEQAAIARLRPWCRAHAWTYRPNVDRKYSRASYGLLPHG